MSDGDKDARVELSRAKPAWPKALVDELNRRDSDLARDILNVIRRGNNLHPPAADVPEDAAPPGPDDGCEDPSAECPGKEAPRVVTRSQAKSGSDKQAPAVSSDPAKAGPSGSASKGAASKSGRKGAKKGGGSKSDKSAPKAKATATGSSSADGTPAKSESADPARLAVEEVLSDPGVAGVLLLDKVDGTKQPSEDGGGASAPTESTSDAPPAAEGSVVVGDKSVHPKMVLSDFVFNTDNFDVPRAGSLLATMSRYALQRPECHRWDASAEQYEVLSPLMRPSFGGLTAPANAILPMMAKIPAAPNTFLRTLVQTDTDLPVDLIEPAIYGEYMIGTNVNARQLSNVLAGKLKFTDNNVPAMLTRFFNIQLTRYSNWALYAKFWYYILGMPLINQTGGALDAFGPWNANIHNVDMTAANVGPEVMHLETWVNAGYIYFVQNIHFTTEQLPLLYLLSCGCDLLNGNPNNTQFPFQTFSWPAFHIVLIWTTNAPPNPPKAARPAFGDVFAFAMDMATDRFESSDLARGYYFASDIIGSAHVQYRVNQLAPAAINCAVTPWHEAFGRLMMPKPHDINVLVRITCPLTLNQDDPDTLADYLVLSNRSVVELAHATILSGAIISSFVTTANYSFQFQGTDLQLVPWNGNMNEHQLPFLTASPWFTNGSRTLDTIPLVYTAALRLLVRCCSLKRPISYLTTRTWGYDNPHLPGVVAPWLDGLAAQPDWTYTWGTPLAISRWCVYRPVEWGISAPGPVVTFGPDVCMSGPMAYRGWSALEGDKSYVERAASVIPNAVVVYAAYKLNVIQQQLELAAALNIQVRPKGVTPGNSGGFLPVQALAVQPPFDPALRVFQPCTIMSYDFTDNTVYSPFVALAAFSNGVADLQRLSSMKELVASLSGLSIGELVDCQRPVPVFAIPAGMRRRGQATNTPPSKKAKLEDVDQPAAQGNL